MKKVVFALIGALMLPTIVAAQFGQGSGNGIGSGSGGGQATTATSSSSSTTTAQGGGKAATATRVEEPQSGVRFVSTLTNVQIELTLTDQTGTTAPEKKTVSMIVSSGRWGRIRSAGNVMTIGEAPYVVDLNVDVRPFVAVDGAIQLELTLVYEPPKGTADARQSKQKINQSQTVVLTSGKPLIISQAADPTSDRKVVVEVKATVLK